MSSQLTASNPLISDLQRLVEGEISTVAQELAEVSHDFGGMVERRPQIVVRPQTAIDVAKVVQYAARHDLTVSSRAAGHSCSGQALNQDGILLDMRRLNQVRDFQPDALWFKADAGTTWRTIVDTVLPHGVVPPVLTNNFDVTIGGTCSAAGLGQNSFRYGTQADNCLGVEVVTATGDLVWCTREENSELFYHVLCGYGQFGLITQIQHRLRRYRPYTRTYFLRYDDLAALLKDEHLLVAEDRVDGLLALFSPCVMGALRAGGKGVRPLIQWFYRMQITVEADAQEDINEAALLADLGFAHHLHTEDLTFEAFIQPFAEVPHPVGEGNPWIDIFLPATAAKGFMETAIERIPSFIDFRKTPIGSFCLNPRKTEMPLFPMPEAEFVTVFGMYPTIPKARLAPVVHQLNTLTELAFELGAKRYMGSWLELEQQGWRHQFGEYWPKVNELKKKYDPQGILTPGFFKYEAGVVPEKRISHRLVNESKIQLEQYVSPEARSENQRDEATQNGSSSAALESSSDSKSRWFGQAIAILVGGLLLLAAILFKTSILSQISSF